MTDLILVPTARELEGITSRLGEPKRAGDWAFQLCGFGPIAAAARTAALISRYRPNRVLLVGIAGSFDVDQYPVASSCRFDRVACYGVGVGAGDKFQPAGTLGWEQFSGGDARPRVGDVIPLMSTFVGDVPCHGMLLSACAASADQQEASQRQRLFPDAVAEDMEGFGVATACTLAGVPLQIVRGISNRVGDRETGRWNIEGAIASAAELAATLLDWRWIPTES